MKNYKVVIVLFSVFFTVVGYTQNTISGIVTNNKDKPVARAQIYLDSINSGVKTNKKGEYSVVVKDNVKTINVFSYRHGLLSSELIEGKKVINFVYLSDKRGKRLKKKEKLVLKYSANDHIYVAENLPSVKVDDQTSNFNNIYDMIRGRVSGVTVSGTSIIIRGTNTILGQTDPLLVVNGVAVSSISDVIPSNVKNIRVLKGPDSAIYGARGSNGVIVITTKD